MFHNVCLVFLLFLPFKLSTTTTTAPTTTTNDDHINRSAENNTGTKLKVLERSKKKYISGTLIHSIQPVCRI